MLSGTAALSRFVRARAGSEALWLLLGRAFTSLAGFVGVRVLTSVMDPSLYGRYALVLGIVSLITGFVVNPIGQALNRFVHDAYESGAVGAFLLRGLSVTSVLSLLGGLAAFAYFGFYQRDDRFWWITAFFVVIVLIAGNFRDRSLGCFNTLRWRGRFVALSTADAWAKIFGTAACVKLFGSSTWAALLGLAIGTVGVALAGLPWVRELVRMDRRQDPSRAFDASAIYRFAAPLFVVNLLSWLITVSDRYILSYWLSDSDVGRYVAGYQIASAAPAIVGATFISFLTPILYEQKARQPERIVPLDSYLLAATALSVLAIGAVVVDTAAVSRVLLSSPSFDSGDAVIPLVSLGLVFLVLQQVAEHQAHLDQRLAPLIAVNAATAVVNVFVTAVAARRVGIIAGALSTCLSYLVSLVGTVVACRPAIKARTWAECAALIGIAIAAVLVIRSIVPASLPVLLRAPLRWSAFIVVFGTLAWRTTSISLRADGAFAPNPMDSKDRAQSNGG